MPTIGQLYLISSAPSSPFWAGIGDALLTGDVPDHSLPCWLRDARCGSEECYNYSNNSKEGALGSLQVRKLLRLGVPTLSKLCWKQKTPLMQFDEIALAKLPPSGLLLDAGCGSETRVSAQGKCRMVVGVDRGKPEVSSILGIDEVVLGDLSALPFPSGIFDVVVSWMVVEHLDKPEACFKELNRVCKDGGLVVLATPNVLHYANLLTKLTPYWFHEWYRKAVLISAETTHPTVYRANTPTKLVNMMKNTGFEPVEIRLIDAGPAYFSWLTPAYLACLIYHCMVNRFSCLSFLRLTIIGVFQKASSAGGSYR